MFESKYELTFSPDYVRDWTYVEAVREIYQNALDEESMSWNYDARKECLTISSSGRLDVKTLILGNTTKADDDTKIGKFGEGYKLALLCLTREGLPVKIRNKEYLWTPKLEYSKKFESKMLTITSKKLSKKNQAPGVTFVIGGISSLAWKAVKRTNLHVKPAGRVIETSFGEILLGKTHRKKIFVNGLLVGEMKESRVSFGYNFKPVHIELDRDRRAVSSFNFSWTASQMWSEIIDDYSEWVRDMIKEKAMDVAYIMSHSPKQEFHDENLRLFIKKFGKALPVRNQFDADMAKHNYGDNVKTVIVTGDFHTSLTRSSGWSGHVSNFKRVERTLSPREELQVFFELNRRNIHCEDEFRELIEKSKKWRTD